MWLSQFWLCCFNPSQVQFTQVGVGTTSPEYRLFQSLTGSIHTMITLMQLKMLLMFQSLTGSIHTYGYTELSHLRTIVSIPHRFNSHGVLKGWSISLIPRFNPSQVQFTPRTHWQLKVAMKCFNPSQVQFTLVFSTFLNPLNLWFQSLTGSIHTLQSEVWSCQYNVSIPHRFNSHRLRYQQRNRSARVSIPHRFNSHLPKGSVMVFIVFCFNPSQVQFTLDGNLIIKHVFEMFQSLTGSIHTRNLVLVALRIIMSFNPSQVQFTQLDLLVVAQLKNSFNPSQVQFTLSIVEEILFDFISFNPSQVQFTHKFASH